MKQKRYHKIYKFDKIFTGETDQESLFDETKIEKMIEKFVEVRFE